MKLKTTPEQAQAIAAAIRKLNVKLFGHESGDPKYNAQRNLDGRTHYAEDDTLRWHKARITSSGQLGDSWGLLFRITESVALDMHNRSRGFRCVVFDVFGTTVYHPDLENTFSSSAAAEKACNAVEFDLAGHYREAIASKLYWAEKELNELRAVADTLVALAGETVSA